MMMSSLLVILILILLKSHMPVYPKFCAEFLVGMTKLNLDKRLSLGTENGRNVAVHLLQYSLKKSTKSSMKYTISVD